MRARFAFQGLLAGAATLGLGLSEARADPAEDCAQHAEQASDLRDKSRFLDARRLFTTCAVDACPRIVREDCRKALLELDKTVPRITLHVKDARGADVTDAAVTVDGAQVSASEQAKGVEVDPGAHVVRAVRAPAAPVEQRVFVTVSDRTRDVVLALMPVPGAPALVPLASAKPEKNRTPAIAVGLVSVGLLAGFGVVGAWTLVDYNHLKASCGASCPSDRVDPVRGRGVVADVLLVGGVVGLGIATVLWITAGDKASKTTASQF